MSRVRGHLARALWLRQPLRLHIPVNFNVRVKDRTDMRGKHHVLIARAYSVSVRLTICMISISLLNKGNIVEEDEP